MATNLTITVFEALQWRQPSALLRLVNAGLLSPAFTLERSDHVISYEGRLREIERLMAHDAYRRVRGAIRQVRWAS